MRRIIKYIVRRIVRHSTRYIIVIAVIFLLSCALIGALVWPYTINAWLVFVEKPPSVTFWHGLLLGFCPVIGQLTIPMAALTWILMLFLT
jgi:hypothetical protein